VPLAVAEGNTVVLAELRAAAASLAAKVVAAETGSEGPAAGSFSSALLVGEPLIMFPSPADLGSSKGEGAENVGGAEVGEGEGAGDEFVEGGDKTATAGLSLFVFASRPRIKGLSAPSSRGALAAPGDSSRLSPAAGIPPPLPVMEVAMDSLKPPAPTPSASDGDIMPGVVAPCGCTLIEPPGCAACVAPNSTPV
jgi:hypothetical protein